MDFILDLRAFHRNLATYSRNFLILLQIFHNPLLPMGQLQMIRSQGISLRLLISPSTPSRSLPRLIITSAKIGWKIGADKIIKKSDVKIYHSSVKKF